jgi:Holliday junction DNA helicase RuvA
VIALVRGEVAGRRPSQPAGGEVVVDVNGVGYRLSVSGETLKQVPAAGKQVTLHSHLIVRDDALQLYGFATEEERDLFLMLLGVQSVGPKVALAVLSGGSPRELLSALAAGDAKRFQAVPGIGRRTAERIIVELREKAGVTVPQDGAVTVAADDDPRVVAREGLVGLGFSLEEADRLLARAPGETAEELIAHALRTSRR